MPSLPKNIPTLSQIKLASEELSKYLVATPVWPYASLALFETMGEKSEVFCKLELFQKTGSFKPRGALINMLSVSQEKLKKGVVAASAGNHAIAVSFASRMLKTSAKVVMPKSASPVRIKLCQSYGAEIILEKNIESVFTKMEEIQEKEQRTSIHPFEGFNVALGTATLGYELMQQLDNLDAVIIPIGGGGLCAGISCAIKQLRPECLIYGVEPEGANSMQKSFKSGKPEKIAKIDTIADSLGAPYALPYSFSLCYAFVDDIVTVSDGELRNAMRWYFNDMKLAVEPAAAASLAALIGPLCHQLQGKRVALIVSGTNIDSGKYCECIHGIQ